MDSTFFGLKRAYHGTLRIARFPLRKLGLTSARFDLLFALTRDGHKPGPSTYQSVLRRVVGVTRPTVSRMLRSLEELGLVRRRRCPVDRRQVIVDLTWRGWLRIRRAYRRMTLSDWAILAIDAALNGKEVPESNWRDMDPWVYEQLETLAESFLDRFRRGFADFASLAYPDLPFDDDD